MKRSALLFTAILPFLAQSCERKAPPSVPLHDDLPEEESTGLYSSPGQSWEETRFTPWMSRAELQFMQETNPADQYFARVEGRDHDGRMEYRAVVKPFPSDDYDQWAVFWGITEEELFNWELKLLKAGFIRDNMQVCTSPSGTALHQIVWLKPSHRNPEGEEPSIDLTSADVIAGQSLKNEKPLVTDVPPPAAPAAPSAPLLSAEEHEVPEPEGVRLVPMKEARKPAEAPAGKKAVYVVKPGDTLGKIARQKGVSVSELKGANGLKNDIIRIGQKLEVPAKPR